MIESECFSAIEEIRSLKARYFRFVDTQCWDELRAIFMPDATLHFPENQPEPLPVGQSIAFIADFLKGTVSVHHGHMPEIEILSSTSAKAIWAMSDHLYFPAETASKIGIREVIGAGHYHETYERIGVHWLIKSLRLTRIRLETLPLARSIV